MRRWRWRLICDDQPGNIKRRLWEHGRFILEQHEHSWHLDNLIVKLLDRHQLFFIRRLKSRRRLREHFFRRHQHD